MNGIEAVNLSLKNSIKRYAQPMFLFKKVLVKNEANASYEKRISKNNVARFAGVFLPLTREEKIELFDTKFFANEFFAKVYTIDFLDFRPEEHVMVNKNLLEIISITGYAQNEIGYTTLILQGL
ncbi:MULTISPECIES: DUF1506 family protein [unclassified Borrelia]|uniref:DUF1506 family protein n=1 Tax=unclassified Borrelia TaxID=2649934 RepID=UPI001E2BC3FE|nr:MULTISPECIES: DUF1506 family protein [unclassified Borrelia]UGQ16789.1 DUF1506 family protein [Borrelia sp. RT5S]UGQ17989.1 DUF1506 family protein [Borrelia sp. RT1S]